jgi:hypothetical protein
VLDPGDHPEQLLRCADRRLERRLFGDDGEVLLIQHSWLTTDHTLAYERNLLWEQELEAGPDV